jgi:hypothetical protein
MNNEKDIKDGKEGQDEKAKTSKWCTAEVKEQC